MVLGRAYLDDLKEGRLTSRVTAWKPYVKKRRQGRQAKRWRDDQDKYWSDTIWQRTAQDRVICIRHARRPSPNHGTQRLPETQIVCSIDDTFVGALGYADDSTLMSPSIRGLKQIVHMCETFAMEYDLTFNEKNTVAILFGNGDPTACHLELNGQPVTWIREVKHFRKYHDIRFNRRKGLCEKTVHLYRHCQ